VQHIFLYEYLLFPIYVGLFIIILRYLSRTYKHPDIKKYFIWGAIAKIIGGFFFAMVYEYYYTYGDTFIYHFFSKKLMDIILYDSSISILDKFFMNAETFRDLVYKDVKMAYSYETSNFIVIRITSYLNFFTFKSYLLDTFLFSIISFSGVWKLYLVFIRMYPKMYKEFAFAILFFPSVVFWGSGLLKDTICLAAIGWLTWGTYHLFLHPWKHQKTSTLIAAAFAIIFSFRIVFSVKIYIIMAYMPAIMLWLFFYYKDKITNRFLNAIFTPLFLATVVSVFLLGLNSFSEELGAYAIDNIVTTAVNLNYNLQKTDAGSTYDIGTIDPSFTGILQKIPQAINVSLFRPYLWEANNPVMLIAAIESLILFLVSIYVFFKVGIFKSLRLIISNNLILFCFVFSLIFSFAVGLTSTNFGTLVRYKIPAIPFYMIGISLIYFIGTNSKLSERFLKK
jgi:hypothetical protein